MMRATRYWPSPVASNRFWNFVVNGAAGIGPQRPRRLVRAAVAVVLLIGVHGCRDYDVPPEEAHNEYAVRASYAGEWNRGWTAAMPFEYEQAPHLILYDGTTGVVNFTAVNPGARGVQPPIWHYDRWMPGFTVLEAYYSGTQAHFMVYQYFLGQVNYNRFRPFLRGPEVTVEDFEPGFTQGAIVQMQSASRIIWYAESDGQIRVHEIGADGLSASRLFWRVWKTGLTHMVAFSGDETAVALFYSTATQYLWFARIGGSAEFEELGSLSMDEPLSALARFETRDGPCILAYYRTGSAAVYRVDFDEPQLHRVWKGDLMPQADVVSAFEQEGEPRLLLYERATGAVSTYTVVPR